IPNPYSLCPTLRPNPHTPRPASDVFFEHSTVYDPLTMLLRDRLAARLADMGDAPDHQRLVAEVLGIRNAPPELARRLVAQALVVEAREEEWRRIGDRLCEAAPD